MLPLCAVVPFASVFSFALLKRINHRDRFKTLERPNNGLVQYSPVIHLLVKKLFFFYFLKLCWCRKKVILNCKAVSISVISSSAIVVLKYNNNDSLKKHFNLEFMTILPQISSGTGCSPGCISPPSLAPPCSCPRRPCTLPTGLPGTCDRWRRNVTAQGNTACVLRTLWNQWTGLLSHKFTITAQLASTFKYHFQTSARPPSKLKFLYSSGRWFNFNSH